MSLVGSKTQKVLSLGNLAAKLKVKRDRSAGTQISLPLNLSILYKIVVPIFRFIIVVSISRRRKSKFLTDTSG